MISEVSASEVLNVKLHCETDSRLGDVKENAAEKHNPEKKRQAQALEKKYGKKRVRSLFLAYWCDSDEKRDETFEFVRKVFSSELRFICYGAIERTEENKKPHCHALVMFKNQKTWLTVVKTFDPHEYHIEPAMFPNSDYSYCKKEDPDNIKEWGEPPHQGSRTDLKNIMVECNYELEKIQSEYTNQYMRYKNGFESCCNTFNRPKRVMERLHLRRDENGEIERVPEDRAEVEWHYGPPGAGKSLEVEKTIEQLLREDKVKEENISYIDEIQNGFFIGDIAEKTDVLVIDDFRGSDMKYSHLLKLFDGRCVSIKGGHRWIKAKYIFITSALSPEECYENLAFNDKIGQLMRRIKQVYRYVAKEEC